jgi:hypothetical protein
MIRLSNACPRTYFALPSDVPVDRQTHRNLGTAIHLVRVAQLFAFYRSISESAIPNASSKAATP